MSQIPETPMPQAAVDAIEGKSPEAQATPPAAPTKDISPKAFEVLAKKEKYLREQQIKFKAEREQLEKDREIIGRHRDLESRVKEDPFGVLKHFGLDYNMLTEMHLNGGKKTAEITANDSMSEVQKLRAELAERDRLQSEKESAAIKAQQEEAKVHFQEEISDFLGKTPGEYELTIALGRQELVFQTIEENFKRTGSVMGIEDAAKLVEGYLEEEELSKLEKIEKLKKRFAPAAELKKDEPSQKSGPVSPSPTLSHLNTSSSTPSMLPAATENERIKRALAALDRK